MPAEGRVAAVAEVYDSKEFTGVFKPQSEKTVRSIYKISQKSENDLHSLGVLHRKKRW